jgi:hypothetical protein
MKEELKLNPHERIVKRLQERKIKERGIEYFNPDTNLPEDLGIEYALCPLYLLKLSNEFRNYCVKYTCMQVPPSNPEKSRRTHHRRTGHDVQGDVEG